MYVQSFPEKQPAIHSVCLKSFFRRFNPISASRSSFVFPAENRNWERNIGHCLFLPFIIDVCPARFYNQHKLAPCPASVCILEAIACWSCPTAFRPGSFAASGYLQAVAEDFGSVIGPPAIRLQGQKPGIRRTVSNLLNRGPFR
jgi:hypothetical protein